MFKVGDTVIVLPNKKVGKVTDISDGFVILDGNQARPYMPQQLELVLKKYMLTTDGYIYKKEQVKEQVKQHKDTDTTHIVSFGIVSYHLINIKKTSDNILDLVEDGDLVRTTQKLFEVQFSILDYGKAVAIYKRQTNGDYKRYEVEAWEPLMT